MQVFMMKAEKFEKLYAKKPTTDKTLMLSFLYYENYKQSGDFYWMEKAYNTVLSLYEENASFSEALLCLVYYAIEMDLTDKAEKMFQNWGRYKNFYKNSHIKLYGAYLYLKAILEKKRGRERNFRKNIKLLTALESEKWISFFNMLTADLYILSEDWENALYYSEQAYNKGCRSFYLFYIIQDIMRSNYYIEESAVFLPFIQWSKRKGVLEPYCLIENPELTARYAGVNLDLFYEIYQVFKLDMLLKLMGEGFILNKDYSLKAYKIYKGCIDADISFPGLNEAYIKSCGFNDIKDIDGTELKKYLDNNNISDSIKAYIFHILLCNRDLKAFIDAFHLKNYMLQYAAFAFKNNKAGKYYNSLYTFLLENEPKDILFKSKVEQLLFQHLFQYKVIFKADSVKRISILEKTTGKAADYLCYNGVAEIESISKEFEVIPYSKQGSILHVQYEIDPELSIDKKWMCRYFLNQGFNDDRIVLCLASALIHERTLHEKDIKALETAASLNISAQFKLNIHTALGRHYFINKSYAKAYGYYIETDENLLSNEDLALMLNSFIYFNQYEKVYMLVLRKSHLIPERDLFFALKFLSKDEGYHSKISLLAYELIIKGWYDAALLEIVLRYYNGSLKNWYHLSNFLKNMDIDSQKLDTIILESAVWMRIFDLEVQQVFCRVYDKDKENNAMKGFAYYTLYEIIVNGVKPQNETISVLEKRYLESKDKITAYALTKLYIKYDVSGLYTDLILEDTMKNVEKDEFFLPEFKNFKDKCRIASYIDKNEPFIYHSMNGNQVYINYKFSKNEKYRKREMQYFRFGIYFMSVPAFYGDEITYYFTEEKGKGSIETVAKTVKNSRADINDCAHDIYYILNNAVIYHKMFRYKETEKLLNRLMTTKTAIIGQLL